MRTTKNSHLITIKPLKIQSKSHAHHLFCHRSYPTLHKRLLFHLSRQNGILKPSTEVIIHYIFCTASLTPVVPSSHLCPCVCVRVCVCAPARVGMCACVCVHACMSQFRSSVLDTRVFLSTYHVSDHVMVVSTMRLKIKAKCRQNRVPLCQTTELPVRVP